jgi:hypothetical protein
MGPNHKWSRPKKKWGPLYGPVWKIETGPYYGPVRKKKGDRCTVRSEKSRPDRTTVQSEKKWGLLLRSGLKIWDRTAYVSGPIWSSPVFAVRSGQSNAHQLHLKMQLFEMAEPSCNVLAMYSKYNIGSIPCSTPPWSSTWYWLWTTTISRVSRRRSLWKNIKLII